MPVLTGLRRRVVVQRHSLALASLACPAFVASKRADKSGIVMTMRFELLGPLQVCGEGGVVTIKGARQRTLLAQLVLAAGHVVSVESLSEAVWGYSPPSTYRTQVAICVAGLRKMFREMGHEEVILTAHPGYRLAVRDHCVDVEIFEDRVRWASEAQAQRRLDDAAQLLSEALALWRGSHSRGSPVARSRLRRRASTNSACWRWSSSQWSASSRASVPRDRKSTRLNSSHVRISYAVFCLK